MQAFRLHSGQAGGLHHSVIPDFSVIPDIFNREPRVVVLFFVREDKRPWIPAFAGMTEGGYFRINGK